MSDLSAAGIGSEAYKPDGSTKDCYRPASRFIEAIDKWSSPKWHAYRGDTKEKINKQTGKPYSYPCTPCGVRIRVSGEWVTHRPVTTASLCKKCFPDAKAKPKPKRVDTQVQETLYDPTELEPSDDLPF